MATLQHYLPCTAWARSYSYEWLTCDLIAAGIVTVMLIPQSLAYAMLAGVPAEMGLYSTLLPLVFYALLGTSRTLSVGPVAVISLMNATAVGDVVARTGVDYASAAIALALLSGGMLVIMGMLRFGFLVNFLSHPVVAGFITSSALIIAISQLQHLAGISAGGSNLFSLGSALSANANQSNPATLAIGVFAIALLLFSRIYLLPLLQLSRLIRSRG